MAKTAAKKRPPARAKATARSAPQKSRASVKKPAARAAKPKVRITPKAAKKPVARIVAKKASTPPVIRGGKTVRRKPISVGKAAKPVVKSKTVDRNPTVKKAPVKSVATAAKAVQKKITASATPIPKSVKPVAGPKLNGDANNGFAKRPAAPLLAPESASPVKSAAKTPAGRSEPVLVPDSRVATNLKPRKNQAGLGAKELENFRALLLEKRREILGDMRSMENEALGSNGGGLSTLPVHMADMGTDNYEQEFTLGLVEKDRVLLREINNALAKIQNGAYGICEGNGTAIGKPRLEVQPWARYSIEFARIRERNGMGIR